MLRASNFYALSSSSCPAKFCPASLVRAQELRLHLRLRDRYFSVQAWVGPIELDPERLFTVHIAVNSAVQTIRKPSKTFGINISSKIYQAFFLTMGRYLPIYSQPFQWCSRNDACRQIRFGMKTDRRRHASQHVIGAHDDWGWSICADSGLQTPLGSRQCVSPSAMLWEEVIQAINALNRHKAAGADGPNNDIETISKQWWYQQW